MGSCRHGASTQGERNTVMTVEGARETSPRLSLGISQEQDQETGAEWPGRRKGQQRPGGCRELRSAGGGQRPPHGLRPQGCRLSQGIGQPLGRFKLESDMIQFVFLKH